MDTKKIIKKIKKLKKKYGVRLLYNKNNNMVEGDEAQRKKKILIIQQNESPNNIKKRLETYYGEKIKKALYEIVDEVM